VKKGTRDKGRVKGDLHVRRVTETAQWVQ